MNYQVSKWIRSDYWIMAHFRKAKTIIRLGCIICLFMQGLQSSAWGQKERLGGNPGWTEYQFSRAEIRTDASADDGSALVILRGKEEIGKAVLGYPNAGGRGTSVIPCPEAGSEYTFTSRARADTSDGYNGEVSLEFRNAQGEKTWFKHIYTTNTYTTKTTTLTVPADAVWCVAWCLKEGEADMYIDWVSLQATVNDTPANVTGFTIDLNPTQARLHWNAVPGADGYEIERKLDSKSSWRTVITLWHGAQTSFLDDHYVLVHNLEPNTRFDYRIKALGDYGDSAYIYVNNITTPLRTPSPGNTTYYVDASSGSDSNSGTSQGAPFKSFWPLNRLELKPGDSVLLKRGEVWNEPINLHGSGTSLGNRITLGAYGTGPKPIIDARGLSSAAIRWFDSSYIRITDLEVSNWDENFREQGKYAIETGLWKASNATHIYFDNLHIHHVRLGTDRGDGGKGLNNTSGGGIRVATDLNNSDRTGKSITDVSITDCFLDDLEHFGIHMFDVDGFAISNNVIRRPGYSSMILSDCSNGTLGNNYLEDVGIKITDRDTAGFDLYEGNDIVVEYNVINRVWERSSGQGINIDDGTAYIVQYNYFHEPGAGMVVVNRTTGLNNIIRYNICQHPGKEIIRNLGNRGLNVYNNTIYVQNPLEPAPLVANWPSEGMSSSDPNNYPQDTEVYNNLYFDESVAIVTTDLIDPGRGANNVFESNLFFGNFTDTVPEDPSVLFVDPQLVSPGSGLIDESSLFAHGLEGYLLQGTSQAIGAGVIVAGSGGKDLWGNPLPAGSPSIGAHEYSTDPGGHATPVISIDVPDSTTAVLSWETRIGRYYRIEQSINLVDWTAITDYIHVSSTPLSHEVTRETRDVNFYRVREAPQVGPRL